jgi:hypothetical protein
MLTFHLTTELQAYTPSDDHSWMTPIVAPRPVVEYHPVTSTSSQAVRSLESSAAPSYFPEAASSSTSSSISLESTRSAVAPLSDMSTIERAFIPTLTTLSTTATITRSTTILVSISATATLDSIQPSATSEAAAEAIQSTTPASTRPAAQVGLGLGIAFLVLSLVAIAGLCIWYRRRNASVNSDGVNGKIVTPFTRLFAFKPFSWERTKGTKDDAEWSIESVEKVSIVRNVRAQSVLTVSRSNSRRSDKTSESGSNGHGAPVALSSHPMTPSYTAVLKRGPRAKDDLDSTGWPLGLEGK